MSLKFAMFKNEATTNISYLSLSSVYKLDRLYLQTIYVNSFIFVAFHWIEI